MPASKFLITLRRKLSRSPWNERKAAIKKRRNFDPSSRQCPTDTCISNSSPRHSSIGASGHLTPANEVSVSAGTHVSGDVINYRMIHKPDQHQANATTVCHEFVPVVQESTGIQKCSRCQQPLDSIQLQHLSTGRVYHSQEYQCDMYYHNFPQQVIDSYQHTNIDRCSQLMQHHEQPVHVCATDKTTDTLAFIEPETKMSSLSPVPITFSMPPPGPFCLEEEEEEEDGGDEPGAINIIQAQKDAVRAAAKLFGAEHPNTIFAIQSMQKQCNSTRSQSANTCMYSNGLRS